MGAMAKSTVSKWIEALTNISIIDGFVDLVEIEEYIDVVFDD